MIPLENGFYILELEHFWSLRHVCGARQEGCYVSIHHGNGTREHLWKCVVCGVKAGKKVQLMYKLWGLNHTNFEDFYTDDVDELH